MKSQVSIYLVHHPDCELAEWLSSKMYHWFRLGYLTGDTSAAGLPVYFRRLVTKRTRSQWDLYPAIDFVDAKLNVVVALVDHHLVNDEPWRRALIQLADRIHRLRTNSAASGTTAVLLPCALHESFYRLPPIYSKFNPVRLLGLSKENTEAALRRAVTETTARVLRSNKLGQATDLNVFLSHAKRDGTKIAETLRDGIRSFGQLVAWYDANDLPYGAQWDSPMESAAREKTAAMIVTLTDAYPTRPWCRREAALARTPRPLTAGSSVWTLQPVVAVQQPGKEWVRGVPMLEGVPKIAWETAFPLASAERNVDRLVLDIMLCQVNEEIAKILYRRLKSESTCLLTFIPDAWTLCSIRDAMKHQADKVLRIGYPGYGLTHAERDELAPVVRMFNQNTQLLSYEKLL